MSTTEKQKMLDIPRVDLGDIYLRAIEYNDYKDMFEYGNDHRVTNTLSWHIDTIEEAEQLITKIHISRPERRLPITYAIINTENNKMIGTCDYHMINWDTLTGEIGYALNYDYWGKGYMTKACKAVIDFGFLYLGLEKVIISHEKNNKGSEKVIVNNGFHYIEEKLYSKSKTMNKFYEINKSDYMNFHIQKE